MENETVFCRVDPELSEVLNEIRSREPIFHTERFGTTLEDFRRATAEDFWEVGASGRRYSRRFILGMRERGELADGDAAGWRITEPGLRKLGENTYLFTYTLDQAGRVTRRSTIWERCAEGWRILYHQGTVVQAGEDDTLPAMAETAKQG